MDDETGKLFVGGLSWETSQDKLQDYFSRYGEIIDCVVMKNSESGRSRGFGFVTFSDPANVALVLQTRPHTLDGRTIDPKPCNPRSLQKPKRECYPKIFLGGLPSNITETDLRTYFTRFGKVVKVVIMYDQSNKKSRGFGFLSFEHNESVERCVNKQYVFLNGKKVEIKKAQPREEYDEKCSLSDDETRSTSKSSISSNIKNKSDFTSFENNTNGLSSNSQKFMISNTSELHNGWGTMSQMLSPNMWSMNNHKECPKATENNSVINWNSWNMPQCGIMAGPYGDTFISQRYVPVTSAASFPIAVPNIGCLVNSNQPNINYTQNYGVDNIVVQGQLQSLFFNTIGSPMGTYIAQSPNNRMFHTFIPPFRTDILVDRKGQEVSPPGGDVTSPKTDPKQNFCKPVQQPLFHPYRR